MLKIDHISKTFAKGTVNEKKALDDISLTVDTGDFITIIVMFMLDIIAFGEKIWHTTYTKIR